MSHPLFASFHTKTIDFRDHVGETVTIRRLGNAALREAARNQKDEGLRVVRQLGSGQIVKELANAGGAEALKAAEAADPFLGYDPTTLVVKGLVGWSLSPKPTQAEIDDLDPEDLEWLARQIVEMRKPRSEADRGEG
jgi:hypothetical protein